MQKLLINNLWTEVGKLCRKAGRVQAAISYVTSAKHLRLKRGDTLIVDASVRAVGSGETSAELLWKLRKRVKLFSLENLHAKIVLADDVVVVGSANASLSSANHLYEAAILSSDPHTVSQARACLYQLSQRAELLDEKRLRELKAIKVQARRGRGMRRRALKASGKSTWVVSTTDLDDGQFEKEERFVEAAKRHLKKRIPEAEPNWIRWHGKSRFWTNSREGDFLVVLSKSKRSRTPYAVLPPSSLLMRQTSINWTRFYYDPAMSEPQKTISWKRFKQLLKQSGVKTRITAHSVRTIPLKESMELQRLWPRKRR